MRSAAVLLFSFAASAFAYQITTPSETVGWTNQGAQSVAWSRVNTDATNFTILLTNEDRSVLPTNNQVLAALVDGTLSKTTVNPPSGGWPVGSSFRINFVQDEQNPNTIYAQSSEFNITASTSSSTSAASGTASVASSSTRSGTTLVVSSGTTPAASGATAGTQTSGAATSSQSSNTNPPGNGAASVRASAGLFAGLALLGAVLA